MFRFHMLSTLRGGYQPMNMVLDEDPSNGKGALWLGDYTAAQDINTLQAKGIKSVLTVAAGLNISYPVNVDIAHKTYSILDIESANIAKIWSDTYQRIEEGLKRGGVLVHCAAGVSRSASTVIAFLMKNKGWGYNEAYSFVLSKRAVICPNFGFQRQLKGFERQLMVENKQIKQTPTKEQTKAINYQQLQQAWNLEITPTKSSNDFEKRRDMSVKTVSKAQNRTDDMRRTTTKKPMLSPHQTHLKQIEKQLKTNHLALSVKPYNFSPLMKTQGKK